MHHRNGIVIGKYLLCLHHYQTPLQAGTIHWHLQQVRPSPRTRFITYLPCTQYPLRINTLLQILYRLLQINDAHKLIWYTRHRHATWWEYYMHTSGQRTYTWPVLIAYCYNAHRLVYVTFSGIQIWYVTKKTRINIFLIQPI